LIACVLPEGKGGRLMRHSCDVLNSSSQFVHRCARWGRFRRWGLGAAALGLPFAVLPSDRADAQALPTGGNVVGGSGSISQTSANQLTINQNSATLSIDWQSFSVGAGNIVRFIQPDSSALALNRVIGPDPSMIFGQIQANGRVVIMNPAGIYFGPSAMVDVNGLVATTSRMNQADFLAGNLNFSLAGDVDARVINEGFVNVAHGGFAVLSAAAVENKGTIVAQGGTVVLAGTPTFTLDFFGDGLLKFASTGTVNQAPSGANALVENSGTVQANGGRVLMTARAARDVINNVINVTGIVEARSARIENGEIVIDGGENGVVSVNASLDVSGQTTDATGGTIKVLGEKVGLFENARLDASGDAGGGTVLVGGNYQGNGPEANAKMVYMDARAVIDASSALADGGRVILWSDEATRNAGHIDVSGAVNGGFIEVSSKGFLDFRGTVGLQGANGAAGMLLLDPTNIEIRSGPSSGDMSGTSPFEETGSASNSFLSVSTLNTALSGGTVIVTTESAGAGTGNIDITAGIVNGAANTTLILRADGAITIGTGGSINSGGYLLNVALRAGAGITVGGSGINTLGGTVTTESLSGGGKAGGNFTSTANINAGFGNIEIRQAGSISIGGTVNTSGQIVIDANGGTTQTAAIIGGGILSVGGEGTVGLDHAANAFAAIEFYRSGSGSAAISLTTSITPAVFASTLGTGALSITGQGFIQSGAMIQDAGGGAVTIKGGTGHVALSQANVWTGALSVSGDVITVEGAQTATGAGAIALNATRNVTITSSIQAVGNVSVWGNAPGGDPNAAADITGSHNGVSIGAGGVINAGVGNIDIAGRGGDSLGNWGVRLDGGELLTSGNGSIAIKGRGGSSISGGSLIGVGLSTSSYVRTQDGGVTINGVGSSGATGGYGYNSGVYVYDSRIETTGDGSIAITGIGGALATSESIYIAGSEIVGSGSGTITLTALVPVGGGPGIAFVSGGPTNSVEIGGGSFLGNVQIQTDSLSNTASLLSILRSPGGGAVTVRPNSDATTIGVAGGTGTLQITSAILGAMSGFDDVIVGSSSQIGDIEMGAYTLPGTRDLTLLADTGAIAIVGAVDLGGRTLTLDTGGNTIQSAAIVGFGDLVLSGGGFVALSNQGNSFDSVLLSRGGSSGNITISTTSNLDVSGASSSGALTVSAPNIAVSNALMSQGGSILLTATYSVDVQENITTSGGDIVLIGNASWAGAPTGMPYFNGASGNFTGVTIGGGAIIDSGAGAIAIAGQGGNATAGDQTGVVVEAGAQVTAVGAIAIYGKGGTSTGGLDRGVKITGSGSTVTGGAGGVTVVGTGGMGVGGYENHGVLLEYAGTIAGTAGGTMQITGTGGATGTNSSGLYLNDGGVVSSTSGNVSIMASAIDYDAISLPNGTLSVGGAGTLTINASAPSATSVAMGSSGSILTGTGTTTLNVDSDISFTSAPLSLGGGLTIVSTDTSGGITINNAGNSIAGSTTITAPFINLAFRNTASNASLTVNSNGAVTLGAIDVQGALTVNAAGAIAQTGAISSSGIATFDANGAGNLTLNNLANDFGHLASGASVVFTNVNNATIWNAKAIVFGTSSTAGMLDAKTASGGISQATGATMSVTGTTALTVNSAGGFVFNDAGNNFGGAISITTPFGWGGTIRTTNDLHLGTINVGGTFSAFAGSGIDQSGILSIGTGSSFSSTTGTIALMNGGNSFGGAVALTAADNTAIASSGTLSFNTVSISGTGNLTVNSAANIAQTNAMSVAGTTTLTAGGGIDLSAGGNMFAGAVLSTSSAGGSIQLTGDALILGTTVSAGNLTLSTTSGGITQSGLLTVNGNLNASTTGGPLGLSTYNNVVAGSVSLATSGESNIAWSQSGPLLVGSVASSGTLNVSVTGGAVSQVGAITTSGAATISADTGNITLTNASNAFDGLLELNATSGSASLTTAGALSIASIDVANSLTLTAGGAITQSGAIQVGTGTTSISATGTMTLSNSLNSFGSALTLTGVGGAIEGNTPSASAVTAVGSGFTFNNVPVSNPAPPQSTLTEGMTTNSVTTETLAQIITQILTSTTVQPSPSIGPTDAANVDPVSPAAVQAMLIAILAELAGPTGSSESNSALSEGGNTTPAVGAGTFGAGTTISINTSGGAVQSITVTPVGGGAPVTILPGLLNLTPPAIPTATATGTPGISGNFPLNWSGR
jgi:filamentous hemagglutinin family protein